MSAPVLLHIPHASVQLLPEWRRSFFLSDEDLNRELLAMTDRYTDELFHLEGADRQVFPVSRLLVDPERFERDEDEPMAARGMGAVYVNTHDGRPLKDGSERSRLMELYYRPHHETLAAWTVRAVEEHGRCLIVDCHSFPSTPLKCDLDQEEPRPDMCVGTDPFHTPPEVAARVVEALEAQGWSVGVNRPYSGTIVPTWAYQRDSRVESVMVEVSRRLYMNEATGKRLPCFDAVRGRLAEALRNAL